MYSYNVFLWQAFYIDQMTLSTEITGLQSGYESYRPYVESGWHCGILMAFQLTKFTSLKRYVLVSVVALTSEYICSINHLGGATFVYGLCFEQPC